MRLTEIRSQAELPAPVERVWEVMTDFASFPSWNPFIRSARGPLVPGAELHVTLSVSGRPLSFRPRLTVVDPPRELRWLASQRVRGLFDVDRRFLLEPVGATRTRLTQSEKATGLLAPLLMAVLRRPFLAGYREYEAALRERLTRADEGRPQEVGRT